MRIAATRCALPSRTVTNDDILSLVEEHSVGLTGRERREVLNVIQAGLLHCGSDRRRWLASDEQPIELIERAIENALDGAGMSKADVDLLIYTGIGRGFAEPANSYHVARALGMTRVHCFDIVDACMSWMRAAYLAYTLLEQKCYHNVLVVNGEFNITGGSAIFPVLFEVPGRAALNWTFPAFTLGEAASATLFTADEYGTWEFHFSSRPELADLCNIPLFRFEGYSAPSGRIARNGIGRFTSFGSELHYHARSEACAVFRRLAPASTPPARIFTHTSSKRDWDLMAKKVGVLERLWPIYPETGNVVSASIPVAMDLAARRGELHPGDKIAGWVGSAGMSFGVFSCHY